jgi:hypothetical protein
VDINVTDDRTKIISDKTILKVKIFNYD